MAQRNGVLQALELTKQSLRVTLRGTREIGEVAVEEEVLMELERMRKTCMGALRDAARAERSLKRTLN